MRRLALCVLIPLALGAVAPSVHAQNEQQIRDRLASILAVAQDSGFAPITDLKVSSLGVGRTEDVTVALQPGVPYFIAGACDDGCDNLDMLLLDAAGAILEKDVQADAIPMLATPVEQAGTYTIRVSMVACKTAACSYGVIVCAKGAGAAAAADAGDWWTEAGRLQSGDDTLRTGEFTDVYRFQGRKGEQVVLDLRSQDFDPYLMLRGPEKQREDNDDFEGDSQRSRIAVELAEDGVYRLYTTTYSKGGAGAYELRMQFGDPGTTTAVARSEHGRLEKGDATLKSGEYVDEYNFTGAAGQELAVELTSDGFDTYLIVVDPKGKQTENDDEAGSKNKSAVQMTLTEPGQYRVVVTSYKAGETGEYDLTITRGRAGGKQ